MTQRATGNISPEDLRLVFCFLFYLLIVKYVKMFINFLWLLHVYFCMVCLCVCEFTHICVHILVEAQFEVTCLLPSLFTLYIEVGTLTELGNH